MLCCHKTFYTDLSHSSYTISPDMICCHVTFSTDLSHLSYTISPDMMSYFFSYHLVSLNNLPSFIYNVEYLFPSYYHHFFSFTYGRPRTQWREDNCWLFGENRNECTSECNEGYVSYVAPLSQYVVDGHSKNSSVVKK